MSHDDLVTEILSQFKPNATQRKVFQLLSDKEWHCRSCEGKIIASGQYAGGGGIQGLQRGTKNRPGLVIASKNELCSQCQKTKGKRGTPFGIRFWYEGNELWASDYQRGKEAEPGCVGCGWYNNFDTWREKLNEKLFKFKKPN